MYLWWTLRMRDVNVKSGDEVHLLTTPIDGLLVCEVLECKRTSYPPTAQIGLVLDDNVSMYADPGSMVVTLRLTSVSGVVVHTFYAKRR